MSAGLEIEASRRWKGGRQRLAEPASRSRRLARVLSFRAIRITPVVGVDGRPVGEGEVDTFVAGIPDIVNDEVAIPLSGMTVADLVLDILENALRSSSIRVRAGART